MYSIDTIRRLWEHAFWADARLLEALPPDGRSAPAALREYAHVVGAAETWLARLEQRPPRVPVWPDLSPRDVRTLVEETHNAYRAYLADLRETDLAAGVTYTNSAGQTFTSARGDILLHVALHGQYHRGKVSLLLRQAGEAPAATDYIAFVRGAPAATEGTSRHAPGGPKTADRT